MNNIINKLQEYAYANNIGSFHLYCEDLGLTEVTDKIEGSKISRLLIGATFLRKKELIEPLIAEMVLDSSKQMIAIVSTYGQFLRNNPAITQIFFENHQHLLDHYSINNKELYCWIKPVMKENFSLIEHIFKEIKAYDKPLIIKKNSIIYSIDYDKLVNNSTFKSFSYIEKELYNTVITFDEILFRKLKVESISIFSYKEHADICFVNPQDIKLIEEFTYNLMDNFISADGALIEKEALYHIADYTKLDLTLEDKPHNKVVKI